MRASLVVCLAFTMSCTVGDPPDDSVAGQGLSPADMQPVDQSDDHLHIEARVCASGATTLGVDVSYYQGTISWAQVKAAGIRFAFVRLSDGDVFQDPKFTANWNGAKQAGVVRGAYQFFRPNQSVTAQADKMIAAIGTYQPGDLPPVIDVEATGGLGPSAVASRIRTWVDRVKTALGVDPIVYTGKYFWRDQVGGPTSFAGNALWVAQYTSLCPDLPAPWQRWAFWQYSDAGHVAGISGGVDMDRFNGSEADLVAFANGSGTTPMPPNGSCTSATLNKDVSDGTCVQAAGDQHWYRCDAGAWTQVASTSSCAATYGWCDSTTLGRKVPPRACVQARSDDHWYQCDGHGWANPVDPIAESGPAGLCSELHPL